MAYTQPTSMDQCLYFTNRTLENGGKAKAWAYKKECPECGNAKMGKPVDPKTGKPKIRSQEYVCPSCGYTEPKLDHEATLTVQVVFTCPHCGKEGEAETPMKRKTYMGVPSYVVICPHCNEKIGITKKMKTPKKKGAKKSPVEDD